MCDSNEVVDGNEHMMKFHTDQPSWGGGLRLKYNIIKPTPIVYHHKERPIQYEMMFMDGQEVQGWYLTHRDKKDSTYWTNQDHGRRYISAVHFHSIHSSQVKREP